MEQSDASRVAFVSTRIAGTDGVSLEIAKWAHVLERAGVECYYIAGQSDRPSERSAIIEQAHFNHPEVLDITRRAFDTELRNPQLTDDIMRLAQVIRGGLQEAIKQFKVDHL